MIEALLEALLELLLEAALQLLAEVAFELGLESLGHAFRRSRSANPVLSVLGLFIAGAATGLLSSWLLPHRLFHPTRGVSGISLLLAPLASGAAMHAFGSWRRGRGGDPSFLATFLGGSIFAFAMALARWWCITRM